MNRGCRLLLPLALVTALAVPSRAAVVINEIMYDSSFSPDVEYVELINTGPTAVNLGDWYLLDSDLLHPRCYLSGTLGVGAFLVIAADNTIFTARYPGVTNLNALGFDPGGAGFGLSNTSDTVRLFNDDDVQVDEVAYQKTNGWPSAAGGTGPSLELANPALDNTLYSSWAATGPVGGTPGVVNSNYAANAPPICRNGARSVDYPTSTDAVIVIVTAQDSEGLANVKLWVSTGGAYSPTTMSDDGLHGDGGAGDGVFGATIAAQANGTLVRYYAVATDLIGQTDIWPTDAPTDYRAYTVGWTPPYPLVINEVVAGNAAGAVDEMGDHEDWLEVHNPNAAAIDLGGMYLTDDWGNTNKWEIPAGQVVPAGGFLVFWADDEALEGPRHAGFKLSNSGEEVAICTSRDHGAVRLHGFKFGPVADDVSVGYRPDLGAESWPGIVSHPEYLATPTPGASNRDAPFYSNVCINEFHTTALGGGVDDWVELYNRGASPIDIGGMYLSDNRTNNLKYQIPASTILPAHGFYSVDETTLGFSFSSLGEVVMLTASDGVSGLDFHDYTTQLPDISEGRFPNGTGRWIKFPSPTRGSSNSAPSAVDEVVDGSGGRAMTGLRSMPNPFRSSTVIRFELATSRDVAVTVHDVTGRVVRSLHHGRMDAGSVAMAWDGRDDHQAPLPSGVYFALVNAGAARERIKLFLVN